MVSPTTQHTHAHNIRTHTHARTHARARTHTHTNTHRYLLYTHCPPTRAAHYNTNALEYITEGVTSTRVGCAQLLFCTTPRQRPIRPGPNPFVFVTRLDIDDSASAQGNLKSNGNDLERLRLRLHLHRPARLRREAVEAEALKGRRLQSLPNKPRCARGRIDALLLPRFDFRQS